VRLTLTIRTLQRRARRSRVDGCQSENRQLTPQSVTVWVIVALKDLLVYVDQTQNSLVRSRLAADLALRHDSYLTVLFVTEWSHGQTGLAQVR